MGKLIAVENNGDTPIFVGSEMVVPGNTRHFDEDLVPLHLRPRAAAAELRSDPPPQLVLDPVAEAFGCGPDDDLVGKIGEAVGEMEKAEPLTVELATDARDECMKLIDAEQAAAAPRQAVLEALGVLQLAIGEQLLRAETEASAKAQAQAAEVARQARLAAFEAQTKAQLQDFLRAKGVAFETDANKSRLVELCMATDP